MYSGSIVISIQIQIQIQIYSLTGVEREETGEEAGEEGGEDGGSKVPELKVQKEEIRALLTKKLEKGDTWCDSNFRENKCIFILHTCTCN